MSDPVIDVTGLTKRFEETLAVDHIDFTIERGVTAALLGGNGAGKTTTISMLLGLLLPSEGSVRVLGADMQRDRYRALPRMNFSSPYVELPHRLTVRENLRVYGALYGVKGVRNRIAPPNTLPIMFNPITAEGSVISSVPSAKNSPT